jgi:hypothetical protein
MKNRKLVPTILVISVLSLSLILQGCADKINMRNTLDKKATLQVNAHWDPIADSSLDLANHSPKHAALLNDLSPAHSSQAYKADAFTVFFPNRSVSVGDLWELDANEIIPFLRQFHPGATAEIRSNPGGKATLPLFNFTLTFSKVGLESEGAYACLRALSSSYAEIVFRIHADFLLDRDAGAYFTPAQFTGRLILNRSNGAIREFWLYLPPRNSNVDFFAFGGADMLFVPRMELIGRNTDDKNEIVWETTITEAAAKTALKQAFYKSAQIETFPIEEIVAEAQAKNRPIHLLLTWGVFDDESC